MSIQNHVLFEIYYEFFRWVAANLGWRRMAPRSSPESESSGDFHAFVWRLPMWNNWNVIFFNNSRNWARNSRLLFSIHIGDPIGNLHTGNFSGTLSLSSLMRVQSLMLYASQRRTLRTWFITPRTMGRHWRQLAWNRMLHKAIGTYPYMPQSGSQDRHVKPVVFMFECLSINFGSCFTLLIAGFPLNWTSSELHTVDKSVVQKMFPECPSSEARSNSQQNKL